MSFKTNVRYFLDASTEHVYELELSERSFISFFNESRLIFKRPIRESETEALYRFISQLRLPISKSVDQGLSSIKIRPNIQNKLLIESKTFSAQFLWDNSDEASLPILYGHLKNLSDYIEAILPLESIGVHRHIPE